MEKDNKKKIGQKWTWRRLGFPDETVRQIEVAGKAGISFRDPPEQLVGGVVTAIVKALEGKQKALEEEMRIKQEALERERISRSILWRTWYLIRDVCCWRKK